MQREDVLSNVNFGIVLKVILSVQTSFKHFNSEAFFISPTFHMCNTTTMSIFCSSLVNCDMKNYNQNVDSSPKPNVTIYCGEIIIFQKYDSWLKGYNISGRVTRTFKVVLCLNFTQFEKHPAFGTMSLREGHR